MNQQQKTVLGVVLLLLFGGMACCSLTLMLGAYGAYSEVKKAGPIADLFFDAGVVDDVPPPEDEDGPLKQQFADEVLAGLADAGHPEFVLDDERYGLTTDGGAQISLDNLFAEYARLEPEERPEFVSHSIAGFFPAEIPEKWDDAKDGVLVTVRDRIFLELLTLSAKEPVTLVHRPLAEDLIEVVVYDGPDAMQYLNEDHLRTWGKTADEVFRQGRQRLVARSKKAFANPSPGVYESDWADNHDVARALLSESLKRLKLKGDPVVFLPQRDHLIVAGSADPEGLEAAVELVDERLTLPRANSGRGWKVTRAGFEPWLPPAGSLAESLRVNAEADDANEQKRALDEKFQAEGTDVFVGTTLFIEDDEGGRHTYAVWTKGAETLMPKAEFIVFVDLDQPEDQRVVAAARWDDVAAKLASRMKREPCYWPVRYHLAKNSFPDRKTLDALALDPLFARNRAE
ncbi:MAG: hypothetical protein ACOZQL_36405 [Myxococcota bacterium]